MEAARVLVVPLRGTHWKQGSFLVINFRIPIRCEGFFSTVRGSELSTCGRLRFHLVSRMSSVVSMDIPA